MLLYCEKFGNGNISNFARLLNQKFAGDWIAQYSPTDRIEGMNAVLKVIESSSCENDVIASNVFKFDTETFIRVIEGNIYGRRFALYIVLLLDYIFADHAQKMKLENLSIEHILPQNPNPNSQWLRDFSTEEQELWTNKIGNLVIITGNKNSSQGRLDFANKKTKYFEKRITCCPNSLRVLRDFTTWTPAELQKNHEMVLTELYKFFCLSIAMEKK